MTAQVYDVLNLDSALSWDAACPVLLPLGPITIAPIISASAGVFVPFFVFVSAFFYYMYSVWYANASLSSTALYTPMYGAKSQLWGNGAERPRDMTMLQGQDLLAINSILTSQPSINLQRLADLFPFTTYDRKRFAAITIRLANPHCTCLLFGSGKLVITGSTSFSACIVASHEITRILRRSSPRDTFEVSSCQIQNLVAHVSLRPGTTIDLNRLYERFNEQSTYQRSIFPGLVLRPPRSPIVLLIFTSGRIVCTGGRSYDDIYFGFAAIYDTLKPFIQFPAAEQKSGVVS